jgi:hypothetical protein
MVDKVEWNQALCLAVIAKNLGAHIQILFGHPLRRHELIDAGKQM